MSIKGKITIGMCKTFSKPEVVENVNKTEKRITVDLLSEEEIKYIAAEIVNNESLNVKRCSYNSLCNYLITEIDRLYAVDKAVLRDAINHLPVARRGKYWAAPNPENTKISDLSDESFYRSVLPGLVSAINSEINNDPNFASILKIRINLNSKKVSSMLKPKMTHYLLCTNDKYWFDRGDLFRIMLAIKAVNINGQPYIQIRPKLSSEYILTDMITSINCLQKSSIGIDVENLLNDREFTYKIFTTLQKDYYVSVLEMVKNLHKIELFSSFGLVKARAKSTNPQLNDELMDELALTYQTILEEDMFTDEMSA